jgi:hypothetical protein
MHLLKQFWVLGLRRVRDEYKETQEDLAHTGAALKMAVFVAGIYLLIAMLLGIYWSFSYPRVDIKSRIAQELLEQKGSPSLELPKGVATTVSLIAVTEALWKKPGGYLANDIWPPGLWLDDMPYWERGVVQEVRNMTKILRISLSQSSINTAVDEDLQRAQVRVNFDSHSWFFPTTESQYSAGVIHLKKYISRLAKNSNSDAHFYVDAQHLNDYLAGVEQRLKILSQRLSASVGPEISTNTRFDSSGETINLEMYKKTPWLALDNIFYEARGSAWAMSKLLEGVEIDFRAVLKEKNAQTYYAQILRELDATQQNIYSPVILNGSGFGFVVNHSLVMASYLSRAQAAVADCRRLLLKPSVLSPQPSQSSSSSSPSSSL